MVTFQIQAPDDDRLNPISEKVTEMLINGPGGSVVGVASSTPATDVMGGDLALGALPATMAPEDLTLSLVNGSELLGEARIRDVSIVPGQVLSYDAHVRKPLIFVGGVTPDEPGGVQGKNQGEINDPTLSVDLAAPPADSGLKAIPFPVDGMAAAAVTSDGRFLIAGRAKLLSVIDTNTLTAVGNDLALTFTPWRVVTAPRDTAVALLDDAGSAVSIITNVVGLTTTPDSIALTHVATDTPPRDAVFSSDGTQLYVLLGDPRNLDPCGPNGAPAPNSIKALDLDGSERATWKLSSFAADIAVDSESGQILVSLPNANQVATVDPSTGATTALFPATCPSALVVNNGDVFVVTAGRLPPDPVTGQVINQFALARRNVQAPSGTLATQLFFVGPFYELGVGDPTPDGDVNFEIRMQPNSLYGYELAVTPDGSRALFATRARYHEKMANLTLLGSLFTCVANIDIAEYGLYTLDTRTGAATYQPHSQLIQPGTTCETDCMLTLTGQNLPPISCIAGAGDRPAGVAAVFGGP
jgi:hypothetical protein